MNWGRAAWQKQRLSFWKVTVYETSSVPSHATGYAHLVEPCAMGATAMGADALIIEVHNDPQRALCDGAQSLTPAMFDSMMGKVGAIRPHAWKRA